MRRAEILRELLSEHVLKLVPNAYSWTELGFTLATLMLILDRCVITHHPDAGEEKLFELRHPLMSQFARECNHIMTTKSVDRSLSNGTYILRFSPVTQTDSKPTIEVSYKLKSGTFLSLLGMQCLPQGVPSTEYGFRRRRLFVPHSLFSSLVEEMISQRRNHRPGTKTLGVVAQPAGPTASWTQLREHVRKLVKTVVSTDPACRNNTQDWYEDVAHLEPSAKPPQSCRPRCEDCEEYEG